jgi:hypothetical protein
MIELAMIGVFGAAAIADWFRYIRNLPERDRELVKCSQGVGIIVCGGYLLKIINDEHLLSTDNQHFSFLAYLGFAVLGLFWIQIGANRAQIHGDRRLLGRAVAKVATGFGVLYAWRNYGHEFPWPWLMERSAMCVALWCWATGATKIFVCLRPMPVLSTTAGAMPYGGALFRRAQGLRAQIITIWQKRV